MGTLSGAGFSKVALISEPYKTKMKNDKKFNLFFYISLFNDCPNCNKFAFYD